LTALISRTGKETGKGKAMKLKEWLYAVFIAIMINGYCKFNLTIPQRLLFLWFLWFVCVCLIYKAEDLIEWVKEHE